MKKKIDFLVSKNFGKISENFIKNFKNFKILADSQPISSIFYFQIELKIAVFKLFYE